jgi:methyl-accepting chemotaxis protein
MSFRLNHLRIRARIYAGFGVLILLGVALAVFGGFQLSTVGAKVEGLASISSNATRILEVGRLLETIRRGAQQYRLTRDETALKDVTDAERRADELLKAVMKTTRSAERRHTYESVEAVLQPFAGKFDQLVDLTNKAEAARKVLSKTGAAFNATFARAAEKARASGDPATQAAMRELEIAVLSARIASARFTINKDEKSAAEFRTAGEKAQKTIDAVTPRMQQAGAGAEIAAVKAAFTDYAQSAAASSAAIFAAQGLYDKEMEPQIIQMEQSLAGARTSLVETYETTKATTQHALSSTSMLQASAALITLVLGVAAAFFIGRSIARPVTVMTAAMQKLAGGDKSAEIPARDGKDEIAEMARAVDVFKRNMIEADEIAAQQRAEQTKKEQRQKAVEAHIAAFDSSVQQVVGTVTSASTELRSTAEGMATTAEEASRQTTAVAAAAEQASTNVQTVATATEELSSSISEIGRQVAESSRIAAKAVEDAGRTNTTIQGLADAAQKIGEVVTLIQDIASQTNLLALNATIEAARAGEAGKGFAVVASEVKTLANQTAKATEEISAQIAAMQGVTKNAVEAIAGIDETIGRINEIAVSIASAVEEQSAATREIARNTQQAAHGTGDVSRNIGGVNQAASDAGRAAAQVLSSSADLSRQAETLRAEIDRFLANIRAA